MSQRLKNGVGTMLLLWGGYRLNRLNFRRDSTLKHFLVLRINKFKVGEISLISR